MMQLTGHKRTFIYEMDGYGHGEYAGNLRFI